MSAAVMILERPSRARFYARCVSRGCRSCRSSIGAVAPAVGAEVRRTVETRLSARVTHVISHPMHTAEPGIGRYRPYSPGFLFILMCIYTRPLQGIRSVPSHTVAHAAAARTPTPMFLPRFLPAFTLARRKCAPRAERPHPGAVMHPWSGHSQSLPTGRPRGYAPQIPPTTRTRRWGLPSHRGRYQSLRAHRPTLQVLHSRSMSR